VNDLSVILSREETVGRLRVTVVDVRTGASVRLDMEKIVQIVGLVRLECFVGDIERIL